MSMRFAWVAITVFSLATAVPASADVVYGTTNIQYDNVNISANTNALSVTGAIGNTPLTMTFNTMIGPDFSTQVTMHCQHGVAFCESSADSQSGASPTGFSSITLSAQAGSAWNAGDFALDYLAGSQILGTPKVTFTAYDNGSQIAASGLATLALDVNGQSQFNFSTTNGSVITDLVISTNRPALLQDIKQVSLQAVGYPVPEPTSIALLGVGIVGIAALRRPHRRHRRA